MISGTIQSNITLCGVQFLRVVARLFMSKIVKG